MVNMKLMKIVMSVRIPGNVTENLREIIEKKIMEIGGSTPLYIVRGQKTK